MRFSSLARLYDSNNSSSDAAKGWYWRVWYAVLGNYAVLCDAVVLLALVRIHQYWIKKGLSQGQQI